MRRLMMALSALSLVPGLLGAQIVPGLPLPDRKVVREEFLDAVIQGLRPTTTKWIAAWRDDDVAAAARLYAKGAFIITPEGNRVTGQDSVTAYLKYELPHTGALQTYLLDVDASDRMAMTLEKYVLVAAAARRAPTEGLLLTVYKSDGRTWRIRSQVFRPSPTGTGS